MRRRVNVQLLLVLSVSTCLLSGCVRRTVKINTDPQGALLWLNDREIGRSPASMDFTWYGDYSLVARKDGFETLDTHFRVKRPWYQAPGIDFFAEVLYPKKLHDVHERSFTLTPATQPTDEELMDRSEEFRVQSVE